MAKVIGNTTTTPMAVSDWERDDENKADYIKNKPKGLVNKEYVSSKFAGAYRTTKSGIKGVIIDDIDNTEHKIGIRVKNKRKIDILPYNNFEGTIGRINATVDESGYITINGVADYHDGQTAYSMFSDIHTIVLPQGTYTLLLKEVVSGSRLGISINNNTASDPSPCTQEEPTLTFTLAEETEVSIEILSWFDDGDSIFKRLSPISLYVGEVTEELPSSDELPILITNLDNTEEAFTIFTENGELTITKPYSNFNIEIADPVGEFYEVEVIYNKSIASAISDVQNTLIKNAGAIKGKASGVSAVAIKDVFEVEHDVKVKISSNNIPLIEGPKIKVFESNLLDKSIFYLVNCTWIDKENGVLKANANNKNYCELASNEEELMDMLEVLNGQTLTLSVESNIPSDLRMAFGVLYEDNTTNEFRGSFGSNVLTTVFDLFYKDDKKIKRLFIRPLYGGDTKFTDTTTVFKDVKLEIGEKSPYSPYIAPKEYQVTEGAKTVIPSVHPSMTFISDTKDINIEVEYNRDANIVIASQQAQIDELKAMILELKTN